MRTSTATFLIPTTPKVGLGTVTIRGMRDYYGTVSAQYKILPAGVMDAAVTDIGQKRLTLSWSPAAGAENYRVEISSDGGNSWKVIEVTSQTSCVATDLNPSTEYSFRLYGCTKVDGKWYNSPALFQHRQGHDAQRRSVRTVRAVPGHQRDCRWTGDLRYAVRCGSVSVPAGQR